MATRSFLALMLLASPALAEEAPELYQRSYALEATGDYAAALAALEGLREQGSYTAVLRRGWLEYLSGKHGEAIDHYKAAMRLAPNAVEPALGLTLPLMATRRWVEAEKILKGVLARAPSEVSAMRKLAFAQYQLGRFKDAEQSYREVLELYPSDVEMRAGLGWSLLKQGKKEDAAESFRQVLEVAPKSSAAVSGIAALEGR